MKGLLAAEDMTQCLGFRHSNYYFYSELDGENSEFVNGWWDYLCNFRGNRMKG
jgi:hypothetical protein